MSENQYPEDENRWEEVEIEKVENGRDGWYVIHQGGIGIYVPGNSPVTPRPGMTARFYPDAQLGGSVRGLFIDGARVWYRTEAEDKEYHLDQMYGKDPAELLARWDAGRSVWTIEMGGMGPGYEQCIHITAFEMLRRLLQLSPSAEDMDDREKWEVVRDDFDKTVMTLPEIDALGLSGAQWGAAMNLAAQFYRRGPRGVMADERVKDRHIQVSRDFPQAPKAA